MIRIDRLVVNTMGSDEALAIIVSDDPTLAADPADDEGRRPIFRVTTYRPLAAKEGPETWETIFKPINGFLDTLSPTEQRDVYEFFVKSKLTLTQIDATTHKHTQDQLATHLLELDHRIGLIGRLLQYVVSANIPIPLMENVGNRPQDKPSMTFRRPEYIELTAVSLLCKLVCPVWGEFVVRLMGPKFIDDENKELYCAAVVLPVLDHPPLDRVMRKFKNYVGETVQSAMTRTQNARSGTERNPWFTAAFSGFSKERLNDYILAVQLVKKFANVDLLWPECDIMRFVHTSINETLSARVQQMERRGNAFIRNDPTDDAADRGDNVSMDEHASKISRTTADIPTIVRVGVKLAVPKLLEVFTIPKDPFEKAVAYYMRNPPMVTPFNQAFIASLLARHIGGARGLDYLALPEYIQLLVITQIYLGLRAHRQLAHLLSAEVPLLKKEEAPSAVDSRIVRDARASVDYRSLTNLYSASVVARRSIETPISELVAWITTYHHFHNTAPAVSSLMLEDETPAKGDLVEYDDLVISEICAFLLAQHGAEPA